MPETAVDPARMERLLANFRRDGYLVVPDLLAPQRVQGLLDDLYRLYPQYVSPKDPVEGLPADSVEVGERRFNAPLRYEPPFDCADLVGHPLLDALLAAILGNRYVFEAYGLLTSLPGATRQHIHRDGGLLYTDVGLDGVLPATAVTVVMPLVDMDETSGRTEFWPGSQRFIEIAEDTPGIAPVIRAGSLVIWDFRTIHSGLANNGNQARPLIYLTACRPFWIDDSNFVPGKNAKLLFSRGCHQALDEPVRARFVRAELFD